MEMISPVGPRTCRLFGLTISTVTLCEPEVDDISYDDRLRNLCIAARTSPVASAYAGTAAMTRTPSPNAPAAIERINGPSSFSSVRSDVPNQAEVAFGERAECDERLGRGDARMRGDLLGHQMAELLVLAHAHHRDEVVRTRHAVALGNA